MFGICFSSDHRTLFLVYHFSSSKYSFFFQKTTTKNEATVNRTTWNTLQNLWKGYISNEGLSKSTFDHFELVFVALHVLANFVHPKCTFSVFRFLPQHYLLNCLISRRALIVAVLLILYQLVEGWRQGSRHWWKIIGSVGSLQATNWYTYLTPWWWSSLSWWG